MSHPVLWPKTTFFYPIGNTAPVCLTRDLPPEQSANILLLGCGDPRNILYTIFAGTKPPNGHRVLDITCCDQEPAILARNVLLFSLIVDGHPVEIIWDIFYHFKIDDRSLAVLTRQCEKLVAISSDLNMWTTSPYSDFLRLCSRRTLSELHRYWQLYVLAGGFSKAKHESLLAAFTREFEARWQTSKIAGSINTGPGRSAGIFWMHASRELGANYEYYWETGTVHVHLSDTELPKLINPTFVYSLTGEGCAVHYGTYPLQSFHLASAYSEVTESQSRTNVKIRDLVNCAKSQFRQWCSAFKAAVRPGSAEKLTIRLFAGDALAFCRTLHHYIRTYSASCSLFVSVWAGASLILDGGDYDPKRGNSAPAQFNIIDTSNIVDHVGFLNIFTATIPLLSEMPPSTLYTEGLLAKGGDASRGLSQHLCAELPTIALLLGITPVAYVSNFASHSNIHELLRHGTLDPQYHERISWKVPYSGDSLVSRVCVDAPLRGSFEPLELAGLLFNIYYRMFVDEDWLLKLRGCAPCDSIIHYHRGSYAALLGLVKSKVQTEWSRTMKHLHDMFRADRKLIMGTNNYQEFCCQLYMRGIYCVETLDPKLNTLTRIDWSDTRLRGWTSVPPVVCLIFVVPRQQIEVLEHSVGIGSPMFHCLLENSQASPQFQSVFSSVQVFFGSVSIIGSGDGTRAVVDQDAAGFFGTSPFIISFWVPTFMLAIEPFATQVVLGLHPTVATSTLLGPKLGPELTLFKTKLSNADDVHVVAERPNAPFELASCQAAMPSSPCPLPLSASVSVANGKIATFTAKWEGVVVAANDVITSKQVSPCAMKVSAGNLSKDLVYPFPIDGARSKLRIARKSGWIEVIVPLSEPHTPSGFTIENFPVLLSRHEGPTLWNIHRISLERSPILCPKPEDSVWINPHVGLALSDRERALREAHNTGKTIDALVQVKDTIHGLFITMFKPNAPKVFGLSEPVWGIYTLIFLNRILLDLASSTLVADVWLLPLTGSLVDSFERVITGLSERGQVARVNTSEKEAIEWQKLLPALVERCRTWSHAPSCQYIRLGKVPLTTDIDQNPLCACGEGKTLDGFAGVQKWKKLAPYVTRAAISPLFAVSYIEDVGGPWKALTERRKGELSDVGLISTCAQCGAPGGENKLSKCSRCRKVSYCGQSCQNVHWKKHKKECKAE